MVVVCAQVYTAQTVFKVLKFIVIVSYVTPLLNSITFSHVCRPQTHTLTGYNTYQCSHSLSSILRKLMQTYISLLVLFGIIAVYTLIWICHKYDVSLYHCILSQLFLPDISEIKWKCVL